MTAITDANTFIDQNLINVPYQGVPATTLNACLKTITNVFNSYATIASVNSLFGYALDGNFPAALMNAPNQAFTLNGGYVSISALLLFSSGQKYTVGPDGNYILNAANGPAWDWSTGRRRLLIEAIGATNYFLNSETPATWFTGAGSVTATPNGLKGILTRANIISGGTGAPCASYSVALTGGQTAAARAIFKAGTLTAPSIGLYESGSAFTAADADLTARVISGPGVIVKGAGAALWKIVGATDDTEIEVTRKVSASCTMLMLVYDFDAVAGAPSAGKTFSVGRLQLENAVTSSSYIVSGATATARAADVVTAASGLLALLTAANVALAARGAILTTSAGALDIIGSTSTFASVAVFDADGRGALVDPAAAHALPTDTPASFANKTFGVAASWAVAGKRKVASNATAVASDNYQLFNGDAGMRLSGTVDGPANMLLDELIVWPILASDAGLQAQARVYS